VLIRLGKIIVAGALAFTLAAHWVLLQSVAWMGMVVVYSEHASFKEAVVQTFDGKHPCCLCKAIAAAKKSEKKTEFTLQTQKLEFPLAKEKFVFTPPFQFRLLPTANRFADSLPQEPPTPPPRGFLV
jgi:hypothetical protein